MARYHFSDSEGDDSRTALQAQSENTPWKSLAKYNAVIAGLNKGDSCLFKRGDSFHGQLLLRKTGVEVGAYGIGAKPRIGSFIALSGWTQVGSSGVWECVDPRLSNILKELTINGNASEKGRWPNKNTPNKGWIIASGVEAGGVISAPVLSGTPNFIGGEVVMRVMNYTIDILPITAQSGSSIKFSGSTTYPFRAGWGFFIQDHPACLDQMGDWCYNPSSKKVSIYTGSINPSNYFIEAATLNEIVICDSGVSNVKLSSLQIAGSNINNLNLNGGNGFSIADCDILHAGQNGVHSTNHQNLKIERSKIKWCNNNAIDVLANGLFAVDNLIEDTNTMPGMGKNGLYTGVAINATLQNAFLQYNHIFRTGYLGVAFGGDYTQVRENFIDGFCLVKDDGSGIYCWGPYPKVIYKLRKVHDNIVQNAIGAPEGTPTPGARHGEGLYADNRSNNVQYIGNTVINVPGNGMLLHDASDILADDNKFVNCGVGIYAVRGTDQEGIFIRNLKLQNNQILSKDKGQLSMYLTSNANDVNQYAANPGDIDHNVYANPFEAKSIRIQNAFYDREAWTELHGFDTNSKRSPVYIPPYQAKNISAVNKLPGGAFSANASGAYASGSAVSWEANKLDGGTLKVVQSANSAYMTIPGTGQVSAGKYYVIRLSGISSRVGSFRCFLMNAGAPLGEKQSFILLPTRSEVEVIMPATASASTTYFRIESDNITPFTYWIDNIKIFEADGSKTNMADYEFIEINPSKTPKTVTLNASYVDLNGNPYAPGTHAIRPYGSLVLLRTSEVFEPIPDPEDQIDPIDPTDPIDPDPEDPTNPTDPEVNFSLSVRIPGRVYRTLLAAVNTYKPPDPE